MFMDSLLWLSDSLKDFNSLAWESRACVNVTSIFFSANKNTINITGNKEAAKHEQVERNLHPLKQAVVGSF